MENTQQIRENNYSLLEAGFSGTPKGSFTCNGIRWISSVVWGKYGVGSFEDALGLLPDFLYADDDRDFADQINERYGPIGGGWHDFKGFGLTKDCQIKYPGDPARVPIALARSRPDPEDGKILILFDGAWCLSGDIRKADLTTNHRIARID